MTTDQAPKDVAIRRYLRHDDDVICRRSRVQFIYFHGDCRRHVHANHRVNYTSPRARLGNSVSGTFPIGRVCYIRIYLCYLYFRWKTVCLVQASMQHLLHHDTVSLQQSKITLQNNCINNTSITQSTLSF